MPTESLESYLSRRYSRYAYAEEIVSLWSGDPETMRQLSARRPALGVEEWLALRYEISLLAAHPVGQLVEREDHCDGPRLTVRDLFYRLITATGGGPRSIDNAAAMWDAVRVALAGPCTLESHRFGMLSLLEQLAADTLPPDVDVDDAVCVVLHYTDYPTHLMEQSPLGRAPMPSGGRSAAAAWPALAHLPAIMADPRRLHEHLAAGLRAPTASRRALSLRLLALDKATSSRQP